MSVEAPDQTNRIVMLRKRGMSLEEIAQEIGVTRLDVFRVLQRVQARA
jgi:transcriptional regulator